jgi:hypothetical protein
VKHLLIRRLDLGERGSALLVGVSSIRTRAGVPGTSGVARDPRERAQIPATW